MVIANNIICAAAVQLAWFNPLSLHDALKHLFRFPKTQLIPLQLSVLEGKLP